MNRLTEQTVIARKNLIVIGLAIAVLLFIVAGMVYRWSRGGPITPLEMGTVLIILFMLVERAQGRYQYDADARRILITKTSWLGKKNYEVSYRQIIGIYEYKAKLIGVLKFRRTFRLNSALDNRKVWVLAYKVSPSGKTEYNERIYFKPSEQMLELLSAKLPGKVMVPENKVVADAIRDEKE